ncbi:PREDICTED: uncharacterized protein LOC104772275 [Camelina sativa]|uniref:Uncharacterized protein LOC104772275 n=1 Tax=Camelina sativa TaxID=90675 RepID=A0ABM0Y488_CAMSA|nr:PREDICTED: uncharacterized protein LOC104772275 [Camelina sativa]
MGKTKSQSSSTVRRSQRLNSDVDNPTPISLPAADSQVSGFSRAVTSPIYTDPSHSPFFLHSVDHPGLSIISFHLDETNYDDWSYAMRISLDAKNKIKFIDGSLPRPLTTDPNFDLWSRCNSMVKSWLLNVVSPHIYRSILRMNDATNIWRDLYGRLHLNNLPRIYNLRQGFMSLSEYYTRLKTLWDQLDGSDEPYDPCACGKGARLQLKAERAKTVKFLACLNDSYAIIRRQIIAKKALPTLVETSQTFAPASPIVMYVQNGPNKGRPICSFCNRVGHIAERCYKKHGFPPSFTLKGKPGEKTQKQPAIAAQVSLSPTPEKSSKNIDGLIGKLSPDQLQNLIALFSSQLPSSSSVPAQIEASTPQTPLDLPKHTLSTDTWVIDSGATHHVSHDRNSFVSLDTSVNSFVNLPTGPHVKISGVGMVRLNKDILLQNVLFIPEFRLSLISISSLTDDIGSKVTSILLIAKYRILSRG